MSRHDSMDELNEQQQQAVEAPNGPLLVLAGAGTGKTRVITARIARLVRDGVASERILAVTFTRKAAGEMRQRLTSFLGSRAYGLTVCTFHALGLRIMREHYGRLAPDGSLRVVSDNEQRRLLRDLLSEFRSGNDMDRVLAAISRSKNAGLWPDEFRRKACNDFQHIVADVYAQYQAALTSMSAIDMDDMILRPVELLETSDLDRSQYQRRWQHVLIDEYQDTNEGQDRLAACLIGPEHDICVVGDDDQSIYGFRGADAERIRDFPKRFTGTRAVTLESNYRSRSPIVALANAVISKAEHRWPKRLVCVSGGGPPVRWNTLADDAQERGFIAATLTELSATTPWSAMAVLVRVRKLISTFTREFRRNGIPCSSTPTDGDGVSVMTLHQAKGLEFPVVFMPAMEAGILPHANADTDAEATEEERRLCYVGITRARERLFISSAERRDGRPAAPSPFLSDVPLVDFLDIR